MKDIFYQFRDAKKTAHVLIPWMVAKDLKPGTPISAAGEVKNNSYAWGLLTHNGDVGDIVVKDGVSYVNAEVIRGGYVDLTAVKELSGYTLTSACKNALSGIIFVVNGKLAGGLPDATAADEGKALIVGDDGEPEWGDVGLSVDSVEYEVSTITWDGTTTGLDTISISVGGMLDFTGYKVSNDIDVGLISGSVKGKVNGADVIPQGGFLTETDSCYAYAWIDGSYNLVAVFIAKQTSVTGTIASFEFSGTADSTGIYVCNATEFKTTKGGSAQKRVGDNVEKPVYDGFAYHHGGVN